MDTKINKKISVRKKSFLLLFLIVFISVFSLENSKILCENKSDLNLVQESSKNGIISSVPSSNFSFNELNEYRVRVNSALKKTPSVVVDPTYNTSEDKEVLEILFKDSNFIKYTRDSNNKPYRNEVFSINPLTSNNLNDDKLAECKQLNQEGETKCYRVEIFNFSLNLTTVSIINKITKQVILVTSHDVQPEVPKYLSEIAVKIAATSSDVQTELKLTPQKENFVMSQTKTAMNNTKCERSKHLCVAPTFVTGQKALWTIVDLTDLRVVGVKWTKWQDQPIEPITEGRLINETIHKGLCKDFNDFSKENWNFQYILTSSDGVLIKDLKFKNKDYLKSYKNVDWHVSYSNTDGFGYSDAIGCPIFSSAAVVPAEYPKVKQLNFPTNGIEFHQDFYSKLWPLPCNYYYEQRLQMFEDGRFRTAVANVGRGCGDNGTYRPVIRLEFPFDKSTIYEWKDDSWKEIKTEGWRQQNDYLSLSPEGYLFKIETSTPSKKDSSKDSPKGFYVVPGKGQFKDAGKGDNAYIYFTKYHKDIDEGETDLATIGPCCNEDHNQGPEKFINDESLNDSSFVFWYVPQMKNNGNPGEEYCWANSVLEDGKIVKKEYPCIVGPLFIPYEK